tara:strand:- start:344 stop:520 length:177 start_codon:yes stop_codon:yes gene_type:complete
MKKNKPLINISKRKFNLFLFLNILFFSFLNIPKNKLAPIKKNKKVKYKKNIWFLNDGD